jgi:hypothetical protein
LVGSVLFSSSTPLQYFIKQLSKAKVFTLSFLREQQQQQQNKQNNNKKKKKKIQKYKYKHK